LQFYYFLFLGLSIAAFFTSGYFYCFHLLHVVVDNDILKRAIESITRNGVTLLNVTVLAVIVVYIFSVIGFAYFREDYASSDGLFCTTLSECFASTVSYGLRSGGGIGEMLSPDSTTGFGDKRNRERIAYDLAFWVLVSVVGMNLVLGEFVVVLMMLSARSQNFTCPYSHECPHENRYHRRHIFAATSRESGQERGHAWKLLHLQHSLALF
jgi:hypothetical protein